MDETLIRRLAGYQGAPVVTSIYLDVDGRRYPRPSDYAPNLDALLRAARGRAAAHGPAAVESVEGDLARVEEWLGRGIDRSAVRGVAAFSCSAQGFFEAVPLAVAVRDQLVLGDTCDVAQLCEALGRSEPVLVVLVDRQRSRLVRLRGEAVEERDGVEDPVGRRVDTDLELGSWERQHEEQARQHLRRVASVVVREVESRPARRIVLAGPPETAAGVEAYLPRRVRARLAGTAALAMTADHETVVRVATELVREARRRDEAVLVDTVRERAEQGRGAVAGLDATLEALGARLVTTLVVEPGLHVQGARCPACGRLVLDTGPCADCGGSPIGVEDVVDAAVAEAFVNHVDVEFCEHPELATLGGIGALVRT